MSQELIGILRQCMLFGELDEASLERVAEMLTDFEVPAGHVLVEHGQPGSGMFIITDGAISIELEYSPEPERIAEWVREAYTATDRLLAQADLRG